MLYKYIKYLEHSISTLKWTIQTIYIAGTYVYYNIIYSYTFKCNNWFFLTFSVSKIITYIIKLCIIPTYMALYIFEYSILLFHWNVDNVHTYYVETLHFIRWVWVFCLISCVWNCLLTLEHFSRQCPNSIQLWLPSVCGCAS